MNVPFSLYYFGTLEIARYGKASCCWTLKLRDLRYSQS